ncbi:hypothetical protein [Aquisediminimonas sediminicola]|uniref:hypothetical protein n=1 Tax=Alteraquisediminimonas sediminicola TaxID=2676787 RepID=UPI001C8E2327|nr:hypothetical protein [Aquisediminimonas sediminicola]
MPFDLFISDIPPSGLPGFKIQAGWLERIELPLPKEAIREIWSPGYRDRYAIISLGEIRGLQRYQDLKANEPIVLEEFEQYTARWADPAPLVLHWQEWD